MKETNTLLIYIVRKLVENTLTEDPMVLASLHGIFVAVCELRIIKFPYIYSDHNSFLAYILSIIQFLTYILSIMQFLYIHTEHNTVFFHIYLA